MVQVIATDKEDQMITHGKDLKIDKNTAKENVLAYSKEVERYASFGFDRMKSADFIVDACGEGIESVLEIGTGRGISLAALSKKYGKVTAVDNSADQVDLAKDYLYMSEVLENITFCNCNAEKLPFADKSYDLVVSANAFHHMEKPFVVIKEMMRVCKKRLVIADFSKNGFEIIRKIHEQKGWVHEEHSSDFDIVGIYLREHGFSIDSREGFNQTVFIAERGGE